MGSIAELIAAGKGVPNPDDEVPQAIRDEFFNRMKAKQSERVCADACPLTQLACKPPRCPLPLPRPC